MPFDPKTVSVYDKRYCIYCQNQENGKLKSFEEVISGSIGAAMRLMNKSREEAEKMADEMMFKLPEVEKGLIGLQILFI